MPNFLERLIACLLLTAILPVLAVLYLLVVRLQGRPFLYRSERMRDLGTSFWLYKIRTMHPPGPGAAEMALGGHESWRVTRIGAFLRRTRLDELPQIFNVIRGDIGFVGPRPPLRRHVAARPDAYGPLLARSRPGITGLATVTVHAREERLLSACGSAEETEDVYLSSCLPLKLRLDRLYLRRRGPVLYALILWRTFAGLPGRRILRGQIRDARPTAGPSASAVAHAAGEGNDYRLAA
jgi:lipopolysaccharide/colanic/teichoic acid biosynthesis glycosyltransferase